MSDKQQLWEQWDELKKICADKHIVLVARQQPPRLPRTVSRTPSHDAIIIDYCYLLPKKGQ